ncbi:MAG: YceI family protein [Elusimicrobia bacterium]|nr:YceI family protein [Elusimicrobiota bacterium]
MKTLVLTLSAALLAALPAAAKTFQIDPMHSSANFKVRHMMVSYVHGKFGKLSGSFDFDGKNPKAWTAEATIDATSIDTGVGMRDKHLRSSDFFDAEKYPTITFKSTGVTHWKDGEGKLLGKLTIRGVTKDVVLDLSLDGTTVDGRGNEHAGFTATTKINRQDFGVSWNKSLDHGGVMVGDEVAITIEVEGVAEKS